MFRFVPVLVTLFTVFVNSTFAREWTDRAARISVEADYVKVMDGKVWLRRRSDRKLFALPLSALCYHDREHVRSISADHFDGTLTQIRYPSFVSRFEIATPKDLYYARVIQVVNEKSELQDWPMLKQVKKEVGKYIGQALDAPAIASHVADACNIDDCEDPLFPIKELVDDCSKVLGIQSPRVFVRNDPWTRAFAFGVDEPSIVLTSGLLELYEDSPEELRFIIGHELGHIKCNHSSMRIIGQAILGLLSEADDGGIAAASAAASTRLEIKLPEIPRLMTPLFLGQFISWSREAEITADRAGLLCCQDPQVAIEALYRLKHGVKRSSRFYDESKRVDADRVLANLKYWENRLFVDLLLEAKRSRRSHPFIEERMAFLQRWYDDGAFDTIVARKEQSDAPFYLTLQRVGVFRFAEENAPIDPFIKVFAGDQHWCTTTVQKNKDKAQWGNFPTSVRLSDGEPVFFELWDNGGWFPSFVGMFAIYPRDNDTNYRAILQRDIKERSEVGTKSSALVKVQIERVR